MYSAGLSFSLFPTTFSKEIEYSTCFFPGCSSGSFCAFVLLQP